MTGDEEQNSEVLNAFLASVCNVRASCPEDTQPPELELGDGELSEAPEIPGVVIDVLCQLDTHRSVGPDGIHPRVMRQLVRERAKPQV